jgi:hypothetical protein
MRATSIGSAALHRKAIRAASRALQDKDVRTVIGAAPGRVRAD